MMTSVKTMFKKIRQVSPAFVLRSKSQSCRLLSLVGAATISSTALFVLPAEAAWQPGNLVTCTLSGNDNFNFGTIDPTEPHPGMLAKTLDGACQSSYYRETIDGSGKVTSKAEAGICINVMNPLGSSNVKYIYLDGVVTNDPTKRLPFNLYRSANTSAPLADGVIGENLIHTGRSEGVPPTGNTPVSSILWTLYGSLAKTTWDGGAQWMVEPGEYTGTFAILVAYGANDSGLTHYVAPQKNSCTGFGAASFTQPFQVKAVVKKSCNVTIGQHIEFAKQFSLNQRILAEGEIKVRCNNNASYRIGMSEGDGAGATFANRFMSNQDRSQKIAYSLYMDTARTKVWGDSDDNSDRKSGVGNGSSEAYSVYAAVNPQPTPAAGIYEDTVIVTVHY